MHYFKNNKYETVQTFRLRTGLKILYNANSHRARGHKMCHEIQNTAKKLMTT